MSTSPIRVGSTVRRADGRQGTVTAIDGTALLVEFSLAGRHTLGRWMHASELKAVSS